MEKFQIDCLIIGAGVAGLAIANKLSKSHNEVFLIEQNKLIGQETSSRNSEVIHAGIYYKENSLKARLCVEGKNLLYEYLDKRKIDYIKCGKFILSTSDQETEKLFKLKENSKSCGIEDLYFDNKDIKNYKFLSYQDSLFSPSTGIFDSHAYMQSLKNEYEENGGTILFRNQLLKVEVQNSCFQILVSDLNTNEEFLIETKKLINCAGLAAVSVANAIYEENKFKLKLLKGDYYSYKGREPLRHLIYPLPKSESLGTHATIDLGRGIRFGPSAYSVNSIDYSINENGKEDFYNSIRSYWPSIDKNSLEPSYSGIRPIIDGSDDFIVDVKAFNDNAVVNILGYVSPGLTSSLALAEYVDSKFTEL